MRVTAGITQTAPQKSKAVPGLDFASQNADCGNAKRRRVQQGWPKEGGKGDVFRDAEGWAFWYN